MYILCNIFRESFNSLSPYFETNENGYLLWEDFMNFEPSEKLEKELTDIVNLLVGFSFSGKYNYSEVRVCFDNIVRNIPYSKYRNIYDIIDDYKERYFRLVNDNYYIGLFLSVIKKIYSSNYDGKLGLPDNRDNKLNSTYIGIFDNTITIGQTPRIGLEDLPFIQIHNVFIFEKHLETFIKLLKYSNCAYNLFKVDNFTNCYDEQTIIKIVFEALILNATAYELSDVSRYIRKYIDFINDDIMPSLNNLSFIGHEFDDEVYFKTKRSDVEYETPWYFAFMLKNHRFELPNVRLAITENDLGEKMANIIAVQSSQLTRSNAYISDYIKNKVPKTSSFRFYNPDHFVSIIITFGILNGLGIHNIDVQDFMPIRFRKTVLDCKMNEKEAEDYLKRVYDKNIACFYKMMLFTDDITIIDAPGMGPNLRLKTNEQINFNDPFLQNLYMMGYNYGMSLSEKSRER